MELFCGNCKEKMIMDGYLKVDSEPFGSVIVRKKNGVLDAWESKLKAAICPKCGKVEFYAKDITHLKR